MTTTAQKEFYSVKEVAERLGVTPTTINRRILNKQLRACRTNGDSGPYRISEEDLQTFLYGDTPELAG
jgi:excisionase family DNA binding protein